MTRPSDPALGIRFVLVAMVAFAVQDGTSKYLAAEYPPQFFIMIRYWIFAVFVTVLAARRSGGIRAACRTKMPALQVFRGVLMAAQIVIIVVSFDRLGLAETHAIFSLHPLMAILLAIPLLGERVGWHRLRLAARDQGHGQLALGVGPRHDVRESEVTERVGRVGTEEPHAPGAEHEAQSVTQRDPEREVDLPIALLERRAPDGARVEDPHAVENAAIEQALVEGRELERVRDDIGGRDDAREKARIVRERDDLTHR